MRINDNKIRHDGIDRSVVQIIFLKHKSLAKNIFYGVF